MTLEEARELKPGDRVLVEAEVTYATRCEEPHVHLTFNGNVFVKVAICGAYGAAFWGVAPEAIREKIAPPRRKFRKGDIVMFKETFHHVTENEREGVVAVAECGYEASMRKIYYKARPSDLKLVCAVEDRADREEVERG